MNPIAPPKPIARDYLHRLSLVLQNTSHDALDHGVALVNEAWQNGQQIITLGNGGSALTALHYINDWNKSVFMSNGRPFRGRSLCDNIGLLMSYANDVSYQDVFAEQLKNILQPGDLVIAISGSGNSENIVRGVNYANAHGGKTLGLCGYRGGKLKSLAQAVIWADVDDMQLSEDLHFIFGHMVMQSLAGMR
ncbi:MAG: SIS domain-containing protein [Candidatus Symbiobacter sp.]|nr:SIS domain-containing protein [Candidatus Symbiobacter sp.]